MNLLASAPVVAVKPINQRVLYVCIEPPIGSPLYNSAFLEACMNEYAAASDRLTGWRAFSTGTYIEIYLHGDIDWEGGAKWL